jgi:hypothetical protein
LIKIKEWNPKDQRPICEVIKCLGEAGNLEAESLRLLLTYDICPDSYEQEEVKTQKIVGNNSTDPLAGCVGPAFDSL